MENMKTTYSVVRPTGDDTTRLNAMAMPINTLNGKTICEVYNGVFKGEKTFPKIRDLLKEKFPDVNIIPFDVLPKLEIVDIDHSLSKLNDFLIDHHCDAIISGNGG